jgi:hypothetical protein
MRPVKGQTVSEKGPRVDELDARVVDLTPRVDLAEGLRSNLGFDQETSEVVGESDDSSDPIEFITENGFSIVRPWESGSTPMPMDGRSRFGVSDGFIEREITVEISRRVATEISLRSRGRIQLSDPFWICCAERHLAKYVEEHAEFPDENQLMVESLDPEDVLLAIRWKESGQDES